MSGTKTGGLKLAATIRKNYGPNYWAKIGRMGGLKKVKKGFAKMDTEKVSAAGRVGGTKSRRGNGRG